MAEWPFEFTWFLIVGLAIGIAIQSHRPSLWGIACGAFGSLVNFGFTTHIFYPQTPWIVVFLEYAAYSVPLFAGALGASIGAMFKRKAAPS